VRPVSKEVKEFGRTASSISFLLAVCGELLAEGQLNNRLLTLAADEGWSATNNKCQEVK
jgi:hypothetical protein